MLADVVVHASTQAEAFGRVVIEAQAMGRPVVAADLGGPVETVEHGMTGWLCRPAMPCAGGGDRAALAMPPDDRRLPADQARAAVLQGATVGAMQDATLEVYPRGVLPGGALPSRIDFFAARCDGRGMIRPLALLFALPFCLPAARAAEKVRIVGRAPRW